MQHCHDPEAVNRSLQDIRGSEKLFGGITVVFGGDLQQILPVILKGSREDIVGACIQRSPIWSNVQILHLNQNMRLGQTAADQEYAQFLLSIGKGVGLSVDGTVILPQEIKCRGNTLLHLINETYPQLAYYAQLAISGADMVLSDQYF